ncbi:MAG: hypothetical protein FVQ81_05710 [Candidatus Glassbacteria bacterium]|nr:hypothetical protein [Candidatus Glassbacteria bacterium]
MKAGKFIISVLAGGSLALGGRLALRARKKRLAEARRVRNLLVRIVNLALRTLSEMRGGGKVSASEAYYFTWITERAAARHHIEMPSFKFGVRDGALASSRLTLILRRMLRDGVLKIEDSYLEPVWDAELPELDDKQQTVLEKCGMIIDEVAAQWDDEAPEDRLVRFGKLFK